MALKQEHGTDEMSKNDAKIGLKQRKWCKQVELKPVKYWQLGTWLPTSSTWKRGLHFFKKKTRPFPTDLFSTDLNLWDTCKFIPPPWYKGGGGGWWSPSLEVLVCSSILKRFCLQWKAFDLLNNMRYILWVVAMLEACDITNNGRQLGFYQELKIRLKLQKTVIFVLDM